MRRFNHLTALEHLLQMDTAIFKEELYYPWYIQTRGIRILSGLFILIVAMITAVLSLLTSFPVIYILGSMVFLTTILGTVYFVTVQQFRKSAKSEALKQMMKLEQKQFMKNLEPFVPSDQKALSHRIATEVDFSPKEYISIAISTKSRILHNTDAFVKDIERMFSDKKSLPIDMDDSGYSDTLFQVPKKAKENYQKMKNSSTFNDGLNVPEEAKAAIIAKVKQAMSRAALGREM